MSEDKLLAVSGWRESPLFDSDERLVLELAEAMTEEPVLLSAELQERLRDRFEERQLVELAAAVAWENYRARFNRVFGVEPAGFSAGAACALPEHRPG